MKRPRIPVPEILRDATAGWLRNQAPTLSAATAFYTLTSLAPLLVIAMGISGSVLGPDSVRVEVVAEVQRRLGPEVGALIDELTRGTQLDTSGFLAGGISLAVFLFSATVAVEHLRFSLNRIWHVPAKEGQLLFSLVKGRLLSLFLVLALGLVLLSSLLLRLGVSTLSELLPGQLQIGSLIFGIGQACVSLLGLTLMIMLIFRVLPDVTTPWRELFVGAGVTGGLLLVGEMLIGYYMSALGIVSFYGAIGSVVVLLLWVYYSSMALFWGAELTNVLHRRRFGKLAQPPVEGSGVRL